MPLTAACCGVQAASLPVLLSPRGVKKGSAPAGRLWEAEVSGEAVRSRFGWHWGDGAFLEPSGRVTLRGLRLARNSSGAVLAWRVGVGRPGVSEPEGTAVGLCLCLCRWEAASTENLCGG